MKIHYLQHVPYEGLASIQQWLESKNFQVSVTRLFKNAPLPEPAELDGLIVMGGPMGVYDEDKYPWLKREKQFVNKVVQSRKPVLGICLGSQILAQVLGANVYKADYKEIGWFPVTFTEAIRSDEKMNFLPTKIDLFHWHGDTYDLPAGCIRVGSSEGCINQGFLYEDFVLGMQFHMEMTRESVQALTTNGQDELVNGKYIQSSDELDKEEQAFQDMNSLMDEVLDYLFLNH